MSGNMSEGGNALHASTFAFSIHMQYSCAMDWREHDSGQMLEESSQSSQHGLNRPYVASYIHVRICSLICVIERTPGVHCRPTLSCVSFVLFRRLKISLRQTGNATLQCSDGLFVDENETSSRSRH